MDNLNDKLIAKFLEGNCSEQELSELNSWMDLSDKNAETFFRMEETFHIGKTQTQLSDIELEYAENKLFKRIAVEEKKQKRTLHIRQWVRYAAAVVVLICIGSVTTHYLTSHHPDMLVAIANDGIIKEIDLPDGTKVWLNNNSVLKYPREFSGKDRNVFLNGEAYFDVTKDKKKPFIVDSDAMRVEVLGTVFNIKSFKNSQFAIATLVEGEIEVRGMHDEGQIILAPGQRAELNRATNRLTVKQVDAQMDGVWHNDLIPFEKANIFTITKALERFYDVKIILSPDIQTDKTYSGVLRKKETIESVLSALQNAIPFNYKIEKSNIFLSPKK